MHDGSARFAWTVIVTSVRKGFPRTSNQRRGIAVPRFFFIGLKDENLLCNYKNKSMKKSILMAMLLMATSWVFVSCDFNNHKEKQPSWEDIQKEREEARKARLQQYADSTVSLSFKGIELGKPFLKTVERARKKGDVFNVKYDNTKESATCKTKLNLPNTEETLVVDIKVTSFQDTITSFIVMSDVYDTHEELERLYMNKYNTDYGTSKDRGYEWVFKNQSVKLSTHVRAEEEIYVKDPNMRSFQNRYGKRTNYYFQSTSIIYTDFYHYGKAEAYEEELRKEQKRQYEIERRERAVTDSIKKEQMRKKAENQDI